MVDRILKFFIRPIALSTCMRKRAIFFVLITSLLVSLFPLPHLHFFVNGGITNFARLSSKRSLIGKPLSAMISCPGFTRSRKPLLSVMYLSDVLPPHNLETNENAPDGVIPTSVL